MKSIKDIILNIAQYPKVINIYNIRNTIIKYIFIINGLYCNFKLNFNV